MSAADLKRRYLLTALAGGLAGGAIGGYTTRKRDDNHKDEERDDRLERILNGALFGSALAAGGRMAYDMLPMHKGSVYRRGFWKQTGWTSPKAARDKVFSYFSSPKKKIRNLLAAERDRQLSNRARYDALVNSLPEDLRGSVPEYDSSKMYSPKLPYGNDLTSDEIMGLLNTPAKWDMKTRVLASVLKARSHTLPVVLQDGSSFPDAGKVVLDSTAKPEDRLPVDIHEHSHLATAPAKNKNDSNMGMFDLPFWTGSGDNAMRPSSGRSGYYIGPGEGIGAVLRTKALFQELFGRTPRSYDEWKTMANKLRDPIYFNSLPADLRFKIEHIQSGILNLIDYDTDIMNGYSDVKKNAWMEYINALFQQARNDTPALGPSYDGVEQKIASDLSEDEFISLRRREKYPKEGDSTAYRKYRKNRIKTPLLAATALGALGAGAGAMAKGLGPVGSSLVGSMAGMGFRDHRKASLKKTLYAMLASGIGAGGMYAASQLGPAAGAALMGTLGAGGGLALAHWARRAENKKARKKIRKG